MIEYAVRSILADNAGVAALVANRIYYVTAPQKVTAPYLVISKVSGARQPYAHGATINFTSPRFQVSIFATTYLAAKQIAQAVQAVLGDYKGTSESTAIEATFYDNEVDYYDEDIGFYSVAMDFLVWYKE